MTSLQAMTKLILLTLAFTNSVTLPVGFPLKIYELVGLLAFVTLIGGVGLRASAAHRVPLLWLLFLFLSLFSSAYGIFLLSDADLSMLEWATGRFHPLLNTIFHYAYLAFDIGLLILIVAGLKDGWLTRHDFARFWLWGAALAVLYTVLLNLAIFTGLPPQWLLRWDTLQYMDIGGLSIVRTGPFKEGNYLGLYLVISFALALWATHHFRDRFFRWVLPLLMLGILISASPAGIAGCLLLSAYVLIYGGAALEVRWAAAIGGGVLTVALLASGLFQTLILDKLSLIFFGGVTDTHNVSLVQRLNEAYHAWLMFLDHPFGVGMGNYGYLFGNYPDVFTWLATDYVNIKRIPNNVYLEVLSEHGFVVFALFMFILSAMWLALLRAREKVLAVGVVMVAFYFLAFPTFRLALIWAYWGFLVAVGRWPSVAVSSGPTEVRDPSASAT